MKQTLLIPQKYKETGEPEVFANLYGAIFCGESFVAQDTMLTAVSIWLVVENNTNLKLDILEDSVFGRSVGTGTLMPEGIGKRTLTFLKPVYLEKGRTYFLRVMEGTPALLQCAVAAGKAPAGCESRGVNYGTFMDNHMAMELEFDAWVGNPPAVHVPKEVEPEYREAVLAALKEKRDVWGEELIASGGVTYDNIKDKLKPLMLVGTFLTETGVYYLAFGIPDKLTGIEDAALLVGDGSQILTRKAGGLRLSFVLPSEDNTLYGSDLERLAEPRFEDEWKPVLQNSYTLLDGSVMDKEMFVTRLPGCDELVTFVKITCTGTSPVELHLEHGNLPRTVYGDKTYVVSSCGFAWETDTEMALTVPCDGTPVYLARFNKAVDPAVLSAVDGALYDSEKAKLIAYWEEKLATDTMFSVPEEKVMNIKKALLSQNMLFGWRYGIGNVYETFYMPESHDAADILTMYGYQDIGKANIDALVSMEKPGKAYINWEYGEKMAHAVRYYDLTGDDSLIDAHLDTYKQYMRFYAGQIEESEYDLLKPNAFSGDIAKKEMYTHWIIACWQGLYFMAKHLEKRGDPDAAEFTALADRYTAAIEKAVRENMQDLGNGSLFLPAKLYSDDNEVFDPITGSKLGTYWNLCIPYGLTTSFFEPDGRELKGIFEYMKNYGTWFLGMMRCNYYPVEWGTEKIGGLPGYKTDGADNVYMLNLAELTSQMDDADRVILMFYGKMAHGMTRGTYVSGEGDTIAPAAGEYYRSCYLPPCGANNAVFLKLLRNMLISEKMSRNAENRELRLLHATPREWLMQGKTIEAKNAPTLFGDVSCKAVSDIENGIVTASYSLAKRNAPKAISLRLRVPGGKKLVSVTVNGAEWSNFDAETATIALGTLEHAEIIATFA